MGPTIAGEIGVFGYKPSVLMDMLAGKRVEVGTKLGAYMRTFSGDCSPSDLETALQVSYVDSLSLNFLFCFLFNVCCSLFSEVNMHVQVYENCFNYCTYLKIMKRFRVT